MLQTVTFRRRTQYIRTIYV